MKTQTLISHMPLSRMEPLNTKLSPIIKKAALGEASLRIKCTSSALNNYLSSSSASPITCSCSDILIADDDEFQHQFYKIFFSKTINFSKSAIKTELIKIDYSLGGTDMCRQYTQMKNCSCPRKPKMAIIDYTMGPESLDGVDSARRLRELGFTGTIILRSSDSQSDIKFNHTDFDHLIKTEKINSYVSKANLIAGKQEIQCWFDISFGL